MNSLESLNVQGKKVIVRVDLNVPIQNGVITDDNRIQAVKPTLDYLIEKGAKIILMSAKFVKIIIVEFGENLAIFALINVKQNLMI